MGRHSMRAPLILDDKTRQYLIAIAYSQRESESRITRAKVLLAYAGGSRVAMVVKYLRVNRPRVVRIIDQALAMGVLESLEERRGRSSGSGRPPEAIAWLMALAEQPPSQYGYTLNVWTMRALVCHARKYGPGAGHPSLADLSKVSAYRYFALQGRPFRAA
ncbi:MAG: integrase [Holophagaceae bacterium]|nr:integrase [Holophagaceae bacterium]